MICEDFIGNEHYCYSNSHTCEYFMDEMKPLIIRLENWLYTIDPEGYTLNNTIHKHKCQVMVSYINETQELMILGDVFLRNFFTVLDYSRNQVSLGVSIYAPPGSDIKQVVSGWVYFGYFFGVVLIVSLSIFIAC